MNKARVLVILVLCLNINLSIQTTCSADSDCPKTPTCSGGQCLNCPSISCTTDTQCSTYTAPGICLRNTCYYGCTNNVNQCSDGVGAGQGYCPTGFRCVSNFVCGTCQSDSECSGTTPMCDYKTKRCVGCNSDSICSTVSTTPLPLEATKTYCSNNKCVNCRSNADCSGGTPFCVDGDCSNSCQVGGCTSPQACSPKTNQNCVTNPCSTISQCSSGQYCSAGGSCVSTCSTDYDCPDNKPKCTSGTCVEASCTTDSDCSIYSNAQYCVSLKCAAAKLAVGAACTDNQSCGMGAICSGGTCKLTCFNDANCNGSGTCSSGVCTTSGTNTGGSGNSATGGTGGLDLSGLFQSLNISSCTTNANCPTGKTCYSNFCLQSCTSNAECPPVLPTCFSNVCIKSGAEKIIISSLLLIVSLLFMLA